MGNQVVRDAGWVAIGAAPSGGFMALLLWIAPWLDFGMAEWAITVQLVGTIVTAFGLFYAWSRASNFWARVKARCKLLMTSLRNCWHRPVPEKAVHPSGIPSGEAFGQFGFRGGPAISGKRSIEDRVNDLEHSLGVLKDRVTATEVDIDHLKSELVEVRIASDEAAKRALAHIERAIADLTERMDRTQVLDLSWAILGLLITAVGVVMSYWA